MGAVVRSSSLCSPTTQALLLPGALCPPPVLLSLPPSLAKDVFLPLTRIPGLDLQHRDVPPRSPHQDHAQCPLWARGAPAFIARKGKFGVPGIPKREVWVHFLIKTSLWFSVLLYYSCCLRHSTSFCELFWEPVMCVILTVGKYLSPFHNWFTIKLLEFSKFKVRGLSVFGIWEQTWW